MKNVFMVLLCAFMVQGCAINYKNLKNTPLSSNKAVDVGAFSYKIKRLPVFASDEGMNGIRDSFNEANGFSLAKEYFGDSIPESGRFIAIDPFYKTPTLPAMGFGYLSVSTLTILPAWSNHDGFYIRYSVYEDGELVDTYQYDRERFVALWIVILPFSWINLMTPGEYDVFKDINNEFIEKYVENHVR